MLPSCCSRLLAGTLADLWDRRRVLLLVQLWTVLTAAGLALLSSLALHLRVPLPAGEPPDLRPRQLPELELALPFEREVGPVPVLIEYRVPLAHAHAFVWAMDAVGQVRKRDGAWRWHLFQDTADAAHWYEAFTVASWLDYLRSIGAAPRPTKLSSPVLGAIWIPGSSRWCAG